jgi:hypothetical protein
MGIIATGLYLIAENTRKGFFIKLLIVMVYDLAVILSILLFFSNSLDFMIVSHLISYFLISLIILLQTQAGRRSRPAD